MTSPYLYRVRDRTGEDHGVLEHPAPNVERGDVVTLSDGRKALVSARIGAGRGSVLAGRREPIPLPEIAQGLKVRCGLADPPPRTVAEQARARGLTPAAAVGGPSEGDAA